MPLSVSSQHMIMYGIGFCIPLTVLQQARYELDVLSIAELLYYGERKYQLLTLALLLQVLFSLLYVTNAHPVLE